MRASQSSQREALKCKSTLWFCANIHLLKRLDLKLQMAGVDQVIYKHEMYVHNATCTFKIV